MVFATPAPEQITSMVQNAHLVKMELSPLTSLVAKYALRANTSLLIPAKNALEMLTELLQNVLLARRITFSMPKIKNAPLARVLSPQVILVASHANLASSTSKDRKNVKPASAM
jgi:hypothetical protein